MQKEESESGHDWTINEINMATVKLPAVAFSPNLVDGSNLVDSNMRSTLLIGLDKNFFENGDDARDVIFVNGSVDSTPIKMHGVDKNFLSTGNYVISIVDSTKEASWENNVLETIKLEADNGPAGETAQVEVDVEPTIMSLVEQSTTPQQLFSFTEKKSSLSSGLENPSFHRHPLVPEDSLPLKNKAKMKGPELLSANFGENDKIEAIPSTSRAASISEKKWKKRVHGKRCCYSDSDSSSDDDDEGNEKLPVVAPTEFSSMADVLLKLKNAALVDDAFADLINAGLVEMKVDIFDELMKTDTNSPSNELLTFAFLLFFQRRAAYRYLSQVYGAKWPTREKLREWRMLVNSQRKKKKKSGKST